MKNRNKSDKHQKNIFAFFIQMLFLFMFVQVLIDFGTTMLGISIINFKYGDKFIFELISLLIITIILLLSKNSYIFKDKHDKFFKSIMLGFPLLIISIVSLVSNVIKVGDIKYLGNLCNLILFSLSIGLFEEFLCRGWLQNEFIERYGKNRKNILISILLASFVFGAMHFINFIGGQPFIPTLYQVISATVVGIVLGAIYFRTKNIWAVAFIHAFWDFAIFYGEVFRLRDCSPITSGYTSIAGIASNIITIVLFVSLGMILLRKEKIYEITGEEITDEIKKKDKKNKTILFVILVISLVIMLIPIDIGNVEKCYNYPEVEFKNISVNYTNYEEYKLSFEDNSFTLCVKDDKIVIKNNDTKKIEARYDYFSKYKVIENKDYYLIAIESDFNNYGSIVRVATIDKDDFVYSSDYFKKLKFKDYEIPELTNLGSIMVDGKDEKFLYFRCTNLPGLLLKDGKVKLLMTNF